MCVARRGWPGWLRACHRLLASPLPVMFLQRDREHDEQHIHRAIGQSSVSMINKIG